MVSRIGVRLRRTFNVVARDRFVIVCKLFTSNLIAVLGSILCITLVFLSTRPVCSGESFKNSL